MENTFEQDLEMIIGTNCIEYTPEEIAKKHNLNYLDTEVCLIVDSIVFNCAHCNWNVSSEEKNNYDGEWICTECADNLFEDEAEAEEND